MKNSWLPVQHWRSNEIEEVKLNVLRFLKGQWGKKINSSSSCCSSLINKRKPLCFPKPISNSAMVHVLYKVPDIKFTWMERSLKSFYLL